MCRPGSHGGRRCPSSRGERRRALDAANTAVRRARAGLDTAISTGDPTQIAAAQQRLDRAQNRLADTNQTPTPRANQTGNADDRAGRAGDATPHTPPNPPTTVNNVAAPGAVVGRRGDVVSGATVVMGHVPAGGVPDPAALAAHMAIARDTVAHHTVARHTGDRHTSDTNTAYGAGIAFQIGDHNVAARGEVVAFQVADQPTPGAAGDTTAPAPKGSSA